MSKKQFERLYNLYKSIWENGGSDEQKREANKIHFFIQCSRMSYEEALVRLAFVRLNKIDLIYKNPITTDIYNIINQ